MSAHVDDLSGRALDGSRPVPRFAMVAAASCMLALAGLVMKSFGFGAIYRASRRCPTLGRGRPPAHAHQRIDEIEGALIHAAPITPTYARCLQRAAAAVWLLRLRGVRAQLVIGVQHVPFKAHSWAAVGDRVVADRQACNTRYLVIDRC